MRYLQINTGSVSNEPLPWWAKILKGSLPAANSDLEQYYYDTTTWWLEINDDGLPQREIGFDANMNPVVLGPVGNNYGLLIDSADDWSDSNEDSERAANEFEKVWEDLWPKFKHLDK